jgi:hypothetical protein
MKLSKTKLYASFLLVEIVHYYVQRIIKFKVMKNVRSSLVENGLNGAV